MRDISNKTDGSGDILSANAFNVNFVDEIQKVVLDSGFTLDPEAGPDTDTEMLSKSIVAHAISSQYFIDSGSADNYILTRSGPFQPIPSYYDGSMIFFKPANDNTGASTINIDSLGIKDLTDNSGNALTAGKITANFYVIARYNLVADRFEIIIGGSDYATDSSVVHLAGTETITGTKTYDSSIILTNNRGYQVTSTLAAIFSLCKLGADDIQYIGNPSYLLRFQGSSVVIRSGGADHTVWHAGNDGALSTLDADLLDGQHGSYYATDSLAAHLAGTETFTGAKNFSANPTISNLTGNANLTFSAVSTTYSNYLIFQANLVTKGQIQYDHDSSASNELMKFFVGGASNLVLTLGASSLTTPFQLISTLATGTSPFSIASTTLNTNLNADLLDGQHGSSYLRSNEDDYTTARLGVGISTNPRSTSSERVFIGGGELFVDHLSGGVTGGGAIRIGTGTGVSFIGANNYYSTTPTPTTKYTRDGGSGMIYFRTDAGSTAGDIEFRTAPSGTTDDSVPYTVRMTIKQDGTLYQGTSNPIWHAGNAHYPSQTAPTAKTASTTLTGAEWATKIITANGAAGAITLQLPTAADMDTYFDAVTTGYCAEEVSVINTSTTNNYTATITTNTGWTLVGDMVIIENDTAGNRSSGKFLALKTGTAAWTLYRTA